MTDTCSICLDDMIENTTTLQCGHRFHVDCIIKALRKSNACPYCRDTDGNETSNIENNAMELADLFLEWGVSFQPSEEEMSEFKKVMSKISRNNPKLSQRFKDLRKESRKLSVEKNAIELKLSKKKKDILKEMRKQFIESEEFKNYEEKLKSFNRRSAYLIKQYNTKINEEIGDDELDLDNFIDNYFEDISDLESLRDSSKFLLFAI